jgi:hypothetical protein
MLRYDDDVPSGCSACTGPAKISFLPLLSFNSPPFDQKLRFFENKNASSAAARLAEANKRKPRIRKQDRWKFQSIGAITVSKDQEQLQRARTKQGESRVEYSRDPVASQRMASLCS